MAHDREGDKNRDEKMRPFSPVEGFLEINNSGHLTIEGIDTFDLAQRYGTPLYVISEDRVRENFRKWRTTLASRYEQSEVFYALKANPLMAICSILRHEGAGFEVGGPGEIYTAGLLDMPGAKLILNGNNKSREEIRKGIRLGATINIDSVNELKVVNEEAEDLGAMARIAFRINPDIAPQDQSVHMELWTGIRESKFGIDVESGQAFEACKIAAKMDSVKIVGIHTHLGSPVEDTQPYLVAAERVMQFAAKLKKELDIDLDFVNLGGGFAIPFKHKSGLPSIEEYVQSIVSVIETKTREFHLNQLRLVLEPGGAIVGDSTILLLTVGMIKETLGIAKWVAVDGGANIILRASQGWYIYQFVTANRMRDKSIEKINIAGPLCYSGDVLARDRMMPRLAEGDILAALDAGAYTFTYEFHGAGSHPLPPVILVRNNGRDEIVRRGETLADIVSKDMIPRRLKEE